MKKLFVILLLVMSIQMCAPEPKLDYKVSKSENYKISEKKMKRNSLEVKKGFEEDYKKFKENMKTSINKLIEEMVKKEGINDEDLDTQTIKKMMINIIEKGIENQGIKIEEIKFFGDSDVQVTQKTKVFDSSKGIFANLQTGREYEVFELVAKKLQYKDLEDMMVQLEKIDKKEAQKKIFDGIFQIFDEELKKEENYMEMTSTVPMEKVNNVWHIKNLDEQTKVIETLLENFKQMM